MKKNDPRSPGATWVNPYLMSPDVEKTIKFYHEAFGFEIKKAVKNDAGEVYHAELAYHDALIMVGLEGQNDMPMRSPNTSVTPCPICLCVYVENVDKFFDHAVAKGAEIIFKPEDMFWGDRACCILDLDGYSWTFCCYLGVSHEEKPH